MAGLCNNLLELPSGCKAGIYRLISKIGIDIGY